VRGRDQAMAASGQHDHRPVRVVIRGEVRHAHPDRDLAVQLTVASTASWLGKRTFRYVVCSRTASTGTSPGAIPVTRTGIPAAPALN
jgi:hypothetical protein